MNTSSTRHAPTFPELPESYRLISFTGAGGKTTLTHWFARCAQATGRHAIVTTTTKIFPPLGERIVLEDDGPGFIDRVRAALTESKKIVAASRFDHATGKLIGLSPKTVTRLHEARLADVILVEADGAARKPLKAPNPTEPLIPLGTDLCIAVMGLDAINSPLNGDTVHRPRIFSRITGRPLGALIRPVDMVRIATAPNGLFKGCPPDSDLAVFFNKADCPGLDTLPDTFASLPDLGASSMAIRWFAGSAQGKSGTEISPCLSALHGPAHARLEFSHEF